MDYIWYVLSILYFHTLFIPCAHLEYQSAHRDLGDLNTEHPSEQVYNGQPVLARMLLEVTELAPMVYYYLCFPGKWAAPSAVKHTDFLCA